MSRILVLHDEAPIRLQISTILETIGHEVVEFASVREAKQYDLSEVDLCICGQVGKYSDGLIFALDAMNVGKKVLIITSKRKFRKIPHLYPHEVGNRMQVVYAVETQMAGDS